MIHFFVTIQRHRDPNTTVQGSFSIPEDIRRAHFETMALILKECVNMYERINLYISNEDIKIINLTRIN